MIADFKTRKMIATGLIMSTLVYIVQVYGSSSSYLINMLQIQQNAAARYVTKLSWYTPTKILLEQCGWLSVKQLIHYHSLLLFHKGMIENKPEFIKNNLRYQTRETRHTFIQDKRRFKTGTAMKSFLPQTIADWNTLQNNIQQCRYHDYLKRN